MFHGAEMTREVRAERSHWRDEEISKRHRLWGWDCPAIDIDFLVIEYDCGKAVALVEYKHENAKPQLPSHPSYRALVDLGNRAGIPVFAVRYADDFSWWQVVPLNPMARTWIPERQVMTEADWVGLLYRMRGRQAPDAFLHT